MLKPAEQTPLTALRVAQLAQEAGFPDGVINVVPGYGPTAGAALAGHMDVDKVAFTGETDDRPDHHGGGRPEQPEARQRWSWAARARTSSSPTPTSTPPSRARTSACSSTRASAAAPAAGCSSRRRSTTSSSRRCVTKAKSRKVGDPFDPATDAGAAGVAGAVRPRHGLHRRRQEGRGEAADSAATASATQGYFIEPTVFTDVKDEMKIAQEEIFGPVMNILKFKDVDEVIERGNQHVLRPGRGGLDARHHEGATAWPTACGPARCGSTATTSSTPPPRSAASRCRGIGRELGEYALRAVHGGEDGDGGDVSGSGWSSGERSA